MFLKRFHIYIHKNNRELVLKLYHININKHLEVGGLLNNITNTMFNNLNKKTK